MKLFFTLIALLSLPLFAQDDEIKTKDLNNTEVSSTTSSGTSESISPEQMEILKKDMETIKENKKQSDAYLEELDKEI